MNLQGKINVIKDAKDAIKEAIVAKGVVPSGNISTYASAISEIDTTNNTSLTVIPSTTSQTLRPSSEYTGYDVVNVNAVTSSIDNNIVATNIKTGVSILGVTGTVDELVGQTKTITENGVYTPSTGYNGFTEVTVNLPFGIQREISSGTLKIPTSSFEFNLPSNVTKIDSYSLYRAFMGSNGLTSVDLSNVEIVETYGLNSAFSSCVYLDNTNLDLSSLTTIKSNGMANTFTACTAVKNVDLSNLSKVESNGLNSCFASGDLRSIDLSSLSSIESNGLRNAFADCSNLSSISFPSLKSTSFGSDNVFKSMLSSCYNVTVHFPSNLQSVIGSWSDVTVGFDGTNTTVLFDLPATT